MLKGGGAYLIIDMCCFTMPDIPNVIESQTMLNPEVSKSWDPSFKTPFFPSLTKSETEGHLQYQASIFIDMEIM